MKINKRYGISLIVLIITIIVMIILSSAIILMLNSSGIIGNTLYAKFATDIRALEERIDYKRIKTDVYYSGTIADLLGEETEYDDILVVEEGKLVYVAEAVSKKEKAWLEKLKIKAASDYYVVEFDKADGSEIKSQTIKGGEKIKQPSDPVRNGYEFLGWYYIKQGGTAENPTFTEVEFDFDTKISSNYSIYAKYTGEAIMMARKDTTAFWQEDYRTNITKIVFKQSEINVPTDAVESWDMRADTKCAEVVAYIEDDGADGYILTVVSPKTIYAYGYTYNYFANFTSLTSIEFSNFDTSKSYYMHGMFHNCTNLEKLDVSKFDTSKVGSMLNMFYKCSKLTNLDLSDFNTEKVTNMNGMFHSCTNLQTLNISSFDTSKVTTMQGMFSHCSALKSINVTSFDTGKVVNMKNMFYGCTNLQSLNLSNFDTSNVIDMAFMFRECSALTSINLSSFNTSNVTDMSSMFYRCNSLSSINVSNFNTEKVTNMNGMFYNCIGLTKLDLINFDTKKVGDMTNMFRLVSNLEELNISNFVVKDDCNMTSLLYGCKKLATLYMNKVSIGNNVTYTDMFSQVPTTVTITTNNITKEWLNTNFSTYKNITLAS